MRDVECEVRWAGGNIVTPSITTDMKHGIAPFMFTFIPRFETGNMPPFLPYGMNFTDGTRLSIWYVSTGFTFSISSRLKLAVA